MRSDRMAETYLQMASELLEEAQAALKRGRYHRVVRLAQESVEFSIKGVLRLLGIEYPKEHDVAGLLEGEERLPSWFSSQLEHIRRISATLTAQRGLAFYGDERGGRPATELFTEEEGKEALREAGRVYSLRRLLDQAER